MQSYVPRPAPNRGRPGRGRNQGGFADPMMVMNAVMKWIHLASAAVVVGGLVYMRFILIPSLAGVPEETRAPIWNAAYRKTFRWLAYAFGLLILTGLDNIFKARRTLGGLTPDQLRDYWAVFWLKMILVFSGFVVLHLLMVRIPAFRRIREAYQTWIGILLAIVLVILFCSGYLALTRTSMLPVTP